MSNDEVYPRLILYEGFSARDEIEINQKGWFDATVETSNGIRYVISFMSL